jgi:hypothetical protein
LACRGDHRHTGAQSGRVVHHVHHQSDIVNDNDFHHELNNDHLRAAAMTGVK